MDGSDAGAAPGARAGVGPLLLLLAAAAAWRAFQWSRTVTMFNDGPLFLGIAEAIAAGDPRGVLGQPHHPLYSAIVAVVHASGVEWESAGAWVSIAAGTAAVGVAFLLLRDAFGDRPAWLGAALLAVHARAVEYSSDVQTDAVYLASFLASVWLLWRAWTRRSIARSIAAGTLCGLAYLTRPEGVGLVPVAALLAAAGWLRDRWTPRFAAGWLAGFAGAAALVAAPYVVAMQRQAGGWSLTQKKSVAVLIGVAPQAPSGESAPPQAAAPPALAPPPGFAVPPGPGRADEGEDGLAVVRAADAPIERGAAAVAMLARTAKSAFRYGPLALLLVGLLAARGRPSERGILVASLLAVYAAMLFALTFQMGYVSRRHALPPMIPLFGYAGLGAVAAGAAIARIARAGPQLGSATAVVLVAAVAAGEVATQLEPRRAEEQAARAAAEWLRSHADPAPVAAKRLRLGYYAGMPYIRLPSFDDATLRSFLDHGGARYLLLDDPAEVESVRRVAGDRLRTLHRVAEGGSEAWVLERVF